MSAAMLGWVLTCDCCCSFASTHCHISQINLSLATCDCRGLSFDLRLPSMSSWLAGLLSDELVQNQSHAHKPRAHAGDSSDMAAIWEPFCDSNGAGTNMFSTFCFLILTFKGPWKFTMKWWMQQCFFSMTPRGQSLSEWSHQASKAFCSFGLHSPSDWSERNRGSSFCSSGSGFNYVHHFCVPLSQVSAASSWALAEELQIGENECKWTSCWNLENKQILWKASNASSQKTTLKLGCSIMRSTNTECYKNMLCSSLNSPHLTCDFRVVGEIPWRGENDLVDKLCDDKTRLADPCFHCKK